MSFSIVIPNEMVELILSDLRRPHNIAWERVGFVLCKQGADGPLLGIRYIPIPDQNYIQPKSHLIGASFDSASIRNIIQIALTEQVSIFHVHLHDFKGQADFSSVDFKSLDELIPCFSSVAPDKAHGAILFTQDDLVAIKLVNGRWAHGEVICDYFKGGRYEI